MKVFLSGEGPSDIGCCRNGAAICSDPDFGKGPLTALVDAVLESRLQYRPSQVDQHCVFISKAELVRRNVERKGTKRVALVGKKRDQETAFYYTNAWMLGEIVGTRESETLDRGLAVLHRDSDDSNSSAAATWDRKYASIKDGFLRAGYDRGVPLLPRPISEAWLLCVADQSIAIPARIEALAGNPHAPHPLKARLDGALGGHKSSEELYDWLADADVGLERLRQMPSFARFETDLLAAFDGVQRG